MMAGAERKADGVPRLAPRASRLALCVLGAYWLLLIYQLSAQWSLYEQYNYGWSVPFLCAYLIWQRVQSSKLAAPKAAEGGLEVQSSPCRSQTKAGSKFSASSSLPSPFSLLRSSFSSLRSPLFFLLSAAPKAAEGGLEVQSSPCRSQTKAGSKFSASSSLPSPFSLLRSSFSSLRSPLFF